MSRESQVRGARNLWLCFQVAVHKQRPCPLLLIPQLKVSINGCIGPTIHPSSGQWSNLYPTGQFMETEMTSQDELV